MSQLSTRVLELLKLIWLFFLLNARKKLPGLLHIKIKSHYSLDPHIKASQMQLKADITYIGRSIWALVILLKCIKIVDTYLF